MDGPVGEHDTILPTPRVGRSRTRLPRLLGVPLLVAVGGAYLLIPRPGPVASRLAASQKEQQAS